MYINIQPAEKQRTASPFLEVHSIFYTIQGEGPFAGHPAVFVRLAGCNLACPGCDTEYTSKRETLYPFEVLDRIRKTYEEDRTHGLNPPLVVITGGEPFRQNLAPLVRLLAEKGIAVQIETNGTLYAEGMPWDSVTVVCSPKAGKINAKLLPRIDAFKYVLSARSQDPVDGLPILALDHSAAPRVARPAPGKPVYLQPMDESFGNNNDQTAMFQNLRNQQACVNACMQHGYILQLQIHKLIGVE